MTRILGIETSCDETGVAVVETGPRTLAARVASQVDVHAEFGGVVPELASRQHIRALTPLVDAVLAEAGGRIDAVAATAGPGLMGSLMVGVNFAKAAAWAWGVPYVPVHHIEGHLFSAFYAEAPPEWPFLALVVSGGHTQLVWCERPHDYRILGATRDDAVGESFDKVARLLDLPYPGGPSIQKAAEDGDRNAYDFPRGLGASDSLEFSYSGLKTAVLYQLQKGHCPVADVAASFQWAAVDLLVTKTRRAIGQTGAKHLVVAGGVAANRLLRDRLTAEAGIPVSLPPFRLCVDNGEMIAAAGLSRLQHHMVGGLDGEADSGLPLVAEAGAAG
jgi:N6-L-threonylcarbamoyladenine synthase